MKILQLCKKFPFPLNDGESIAVTYLSKALHNQGCEITLLCMNTKKHYTEIDALPEDFNHYKSIYVSEIDNNISAFGAFLNLFSKDSYHVSRFVSEDFNSKLIQLLNEEAFDIIQLETLYLAPYVDTIRNHSDALVTMRAHNVEHEIWERISNNTRLLPKKWYLNYLTKKLKRFELEKLNDYDYLVPVTNQDLKKFKKLGYKNGALANPIGIDVNNYHKIKLNTNELSIGFIGSMDWIPNIEGIEWFTRVVWPQINMKFPKLKMEIAGRNTPQKYKDANLSNASFIGEVPNAIKFINKHSVMIVPLLSGSGMRVKILEGMALGKIVITTTIGLEGIPAEHKNQVLIADSAEQFVEAIQYCYDYPEKMKAISVNAVQFVESYFDNQQNAAELKKLYEHLIENYQPKKKLL